MDKDNVEIKPSTRHDIDTFFKGEMRDTCYAWSVFKNCELVCIAGVSVTKTVMLAFSTVKEGLEYNKQTAWRVIKKLWENIMGLGFSILYATASPDFLTAPRLLEKLGFKHIESSERGEVYRWVIR